MARPKSLTRTQIVDRSMQRFWHYGYGATSIDDLVRSTGTNRHAIYSEFGGKEQLFAKCLEVYSSCVVTPAFARVEAPDAGLADIAAYFEHQIALAESAGLPGPGCLMSNAMTEIAPHDRRSAALVTRHLSRLQKGFADALGNELRKPVRSKALRSRIDTLALTLVVFANGLWSVSRVTAHARELRNSVGVMLDGLRTELRALPR